MTDGTPNDTIHDGVGSYDVVLLVEQQLSADDARQVRSLHEDIADTVTYHVLIPLEDASARIEASMGSLAAGEMLATPAMTMRDVDLEAVRKECQEQSAAELSASVRALEEAGAVVGGSTVVAEPPVDALATKVGEVEAREAIILTRPHVVAEFFHLDWTSKARRRLGVPVLHLLERETFDEQAGGGEGVTGV